ncbi:MAG: STING domain-containing protein, partial [Cyclobacteriaceae bacterium]
MITDNYISHGLAVAYFYNFVKRLFNQVGQGSVITFDDQSFQANPDNFVLKILLPDNLSEEETNKCHDYLNSFTEVRLK